MDYHSLVPRAFDLAPYRFGLPQCSGAMTVVPIFGVDHPDTFAPPLSGLKLSQVRGYGNMELANAAGAGVAIVPLHMGYIQDQAQNHALCRSGFIGPGQKRMFDDACCVQAAQGGYLEGREQWFFILPVQLRAQALELRGEKSYSKLWDAIGALNTAFGLPGRGHLEQIVSRSRAVLTQYQSRFELLAGQIGALFFVEDRLAGVEIAPSAAYFQELWMPLVCFCYGAAALQVEQRPGQDPRPPAEPFPAHTLPELRAQLAASRQERLAQIETWLTTTPAEAWEGHEEERLLSLRLHTILGRNYAGQFVEDGKGLVYASLFARPEYLTRN
ncbi:MAG TPA: hypothetical protein VKY74_17975 [Chloroflexia bacterium]|nr:hypothetical protein [Chloroflexia bacterium]